MSYFCELTFLPDNLRAWLSIHRTLKDKLCLVGDLDRFWHFSDFKIWKIKEDKQKNFSYFTLYFT